VKTRCTSQYVPITAGKQKQMRGVRYAPRPCDSKPSKEIASATAMKEQCSEEAKFGPLAAPNAE
jgi:hypothetical protein